jgi:sec-independent protein translocase protein TatB
MDSFFGIGVFELVFIFIFALIFLGPERLPQVMRQVLGFIRQVRSLSSDISKQINTEFGDLGELDPRKIVNDVTAPVKDELKSTSKSLATPKANPNATPKKITPAQPKTSPAKTETAAKPVPKATPAQKSAAANAASESDVSEKITPARENGADPGVEHQNHVPAAPPQGDAIDDEVRNIAPPSLAQKTAAQPEGNEAEPERVAPRAAEEGSV